jgi:hypothetical protein
MTQKKYFLKKAQEAREHAKEAGDAWVKAALEDLAGNYEALAEEEGGADGIDAPPSSSRLPRSGTAFNV